MPPLVEVFTGPGCTRCAAATSMLGEADVPFAEIDVSTDEGMADYRDRLPRARSIPQVFVDGDHVGNEDDVRDLLAAGGL